MGEFNKRNLIDYQIDTKGDINSINGKIWLIVMANLKEGLTNVLKYSGAKHIRFSIEVLSQLIRFRLEDDGVGADIIRSGMGLSGMEERMAELNGTLILDGSNGFSIIMLFKRSNV